MSIASLKRALIGHPLPTQRLAHERLNKLQGLAVFSSDALSSSAYATEEILLALIVAGPAVLYLAWPISLAITSVLAIVAFSYYQTIHAYPGGGGAYVVARSNLGVWPGLVAAAALLIDYVLTVAVSISAGVAAITSAAPVLFPYRVTLAVIAVGIIAVLNLRGVRESGTVISIPAYTFIAVMLALVGLGIARSLGSPPSPPHVPLEQAVLQPLTVFLLFRAFASGSAAMTGIEAIANGVQAFRPPAARNAGLTLIWMAAILGTLFLGLTYLAGHFGIAPAEHETVVSQIARTVFGVGALYYLAQFATAMILILAANTSFAGAPRLASILAEDRFAPHQLANLGDRLVYANGIVLLALASGVLVYAFGADTHRLIPLYAVGVFLSFTLSQVGMVRKWWNERGPGWRRSMVFNALGATATAVVLVVVIVGKFIQGAWVVTLAIPALVWIMRSIGLHYQHVRQELSLEGVSVPVAGHIQHKVLVPVGGMHRGILPALRYAKSLSDDVTAVTVDIDPADTAELQGKWQRWGMGVPLKVLESPYRSIIGPFIRYLGDLEWEVGFDQQLTVVLPEFVPTRWWHFLLHNQNAFLLKAVLLFRRRRGHRVTVVTDVPYYLMEAEESALPPPAPRDRAMMWLGALLGAALLGLFWATRAGWGTPFPEAFGLSALLLLVVIMFRLFVRSLKL